MNRRKGSSPGLLILVIATAACSSLFGCGRTDAPEGTVTNRAAVPAPPDVAAPPADAVRAPTGLASKVITQGTGTRHPRPNSRVQVHYTGWTTDGKMFDTSVGGAPASFSLSGVIPGWTQGVQMMVEGEKRRFWIPPKLAYEGGGGPEGMLVFDIHLVRIED